MSPAAVPCREQRLLTVRERPPGSAARLRFGTMPRAVDWPLVGRAKELAAIADLLGHTERSGVVLAGPPGVGKTRLAEECAALAGRAGFRVVTVSASDATRAIPLGALAHLLEPESRRDVRAELLQRVAATIAAGPTPVLLIVDDGHLLDDASAAVVHQLAFDRQAFVAMTVRAGEPVPDPVLKLWKDGLALRLDLAPLSEHDIDELLGATLGPVDGATRRQLWTRSEGNALYLRELVLGAIEAGALSESDGVWRLTGSLVASPRLTELVEARLAGLQEPERRALELVSAGEPLDIRIVESVVGLGPLEALDARGLLAVDWTAGHHELSLAHPLHGEVLRASMSPLRRMGVYRTLADAVTASGPVADRDLVRVAWWRLEGGGDVDHQLMVAAARRAYVEHGDDLAERFARAALESPGATAEGRAEAGLVLVQVLGWSARHDERIELATRMMGWPLDEATSAMVVMEWANSLYWGRNDERGALSLIDDHASAVTDPKVRDELHALAAAFQLLSGRPVDAIAEAEPILARDDGRAYHEAATAAGPALAIVGRGERAVHVAQRAFELGGALGPQDAMADPGLHVVTQVLAMVELGRLADAAYVADVAYDMAIAQRTRTGQGWFALMRGRVALQTGDIAGALRNFGEASALLTEVGWPGVRRWAAAGRMLASAAAGDLATCSAAAEKLGSVDPGPARMMEPDIVRARAWLAHLVVDEAGRDHLLDEAVAIAMHAGTLALAVQAWHDIARFGRAAQAAPALADLARSVDGPYAGVRAAHAGALARNDADGLVAVAADFERLGALLFAAEALAAASALTLRSGSRRAADALSRRSLALAERCPGAATPALALAGPGAVLTTREREVAVLAAEGLASKEIAARLGRSVRTVDNHLQRAYQKLGVSSRDDLASALALES